MNGVGVRELVSIKKKAQAWNESLNKNENLKKINKTFPQNPHKRGKSYHRDTEDDVIHIIRWWGRKPPIVFLTASG